MAAATRRASLSFISRVPDDILIELFNYVPLRDRIRSQRVCRRFRDVLNRHGWKGGHVFDYTSLKFLFTMDEWREFMDSCEIEWNWRSNTDLWAPGKARNALNHIESFFQRMGPFLKELDMATNLPLILVDYCWTKALRHCTQLEKLKIGFDDSWALSLLALFGCKCIFGNLVEIDFARTDMDPETDWDRAADSICPFLKGNQQLRALSLSNFPGDVSCFLMNLPQTLEELNITGDVHSCSSFTWPALLKAKERCPGLKKLVFTEIDIYHVEAADCPFDMFERLESLRFSGKGLSDFTFRDMPALVECYLSGTCGVTDKTLVSLCVAAPNLVIFAINNNEKLSFSLEKISSLTRLEKLNVNNVEKFNDDALKVIAKDGRLTHISVSSTAVSSLGIQALLESCEHLVFIEVSRELALETAEQLGDYATRRRKPLRIKPERCSCRSCEVSRSRFRQMRFGAVPICTLKQSLNRYPLLQLIGY